MVTDWLTKIFGYAVLILLSVSFVFGNTSRAETSSSGNYQATEVEFGAGGELDSCSGEYCAQASIGSLDGGQATSNSFSASFDQLDDGSEPVLEVIIEPGESNLGVLTTEVTATKTTKVKIRSYMSSGYTLHLFGEIPRYQEHKLKALIVPTESTPGIEQFGINVVANTSPSVGANPVHVPSGEISFGYPSEDYGQQNLYKYINGDEIARSDVETGQTDFTISMVVNISNLTPAGHFVSDFSAVVVPVF